MLIDDFPVGGCGGGCLTPGELERLIFVSTEMERRHSDFMWLGGGLPWRERRLPASGSTTKRLNGMDRCRSYVLGDAFSSSGAEEVLREPKFLNKLSKLFIDICEPKGSSTMVSFPSDTQPESTDTDCIYVGVLE